MSVTLPCNELSPLYHQSSTSIPAEQALAAQRKHHHSQRPRASILRLYSRLYSRHPYLYLRCHALSSSSGAEVPSGSTGYRFPMSDLFLSKEELAKFANVDFSKLAPGEKPPWVQDSQVRAQDEEDWWWRSSCCSAPHDVC